MTDPALAPIETTEGGGGVVPFRSRQAVTRSVAQPTIDTDALISKAKMIAVAGDVLPKHYQNNQGACLLAVDWAERNGVPIFEALANVAFVHGKPVIQGRLQRKMAAKAGYTTRKIEGDASSCTVAVFDPEGNEVNGDGKGRATFTFELAEKLGLVKNNPLYNKDPAQMLYWRATTRALDHYGPGGLSTVFIEEPVDTPNDVFPDGPLNAPEPDGVPVIDVGSVEVGDVTAGDVQMAAGEKGLKPASLLRQARSEFPNAKFTAIDDVWKHGEAMAALLDWIDQQ